MSPSTLFTFDAILSGNLNELENHDLEPYLPYLSGLYVASTGERQMKLFKLLQKYEFMNTCINFHNTVNKVPWNSISPFFTSSELDLDSVENSIQIFENSTDIATRMMLVYSFILFFSFTNLLNLPYKHITLGFLSKSWQLVFQ